MLRAAARTIIKATCRGLRDSLYGPVSIAVHPAAPAPAACCTAPAKVRDSTNFHSYFLCVCVSNL